MTGTKSYPTPAADRLAQATPLLEAQIRAYRLGRIRIWGQSNHTRADLREAIAAAGMPMPVKATTAKALVDTLVDWDMTGNPDRTPVIAQLAALRRRAAEERYILSGVADHVVEDVDAKYRVMLRGSADALASPAWTAGTAVRWQEERSTAMAWNFVARTIDKGKTPHEAAAEAVKYFTGQVIQASRNANGGRAPIDAALNGSEHAAYAKFLDKLVILDGIVSTEAF